MAQAQHMYSVYTCTLIMCILSHWYIPLRCLLGPHLWSSCHGCVVEEAEGWPALSVSTQEEIVKEEMSPEQGGGIEVKER